MQQGEKKHRKHKKHLDWKESSKTVFEDDMVTMPFSTNGPVVTDYLYILKINFGKILK